MPPRSPSPETPGPATILVVDDDPDVLRTVGAYLARAIPLSRIESASSGQEGLEILRRRDVDLIVSDHRMGGMDGLEFLARARRMRPDVPRIMLTAFPKVDLAVQALNEQKVTFFLLKPVHPHRLFSAIQDALQARRRDVLRDAALAQALSIVTDLWQDACAPAEAAPRQAQ